MNLDFGIYAKYKKILGLTDKDIADRLGISRTYLNAIVNGKRREVGTIVKDIAQIIGIAENELKGDYDGD